VLAVAVKRPWYIRWQENLSWPIAAAILVLIFIAECLVLYEIEQLLS
jgi:hypothetical protein